MKQLFTMLIVLFSVAALYAADGAVAGKLGYSYESRETLQEDDTDSWYVEGDTLVVVWTSGFSTERFQIVPEDGIFIGSKKSKNYSGEKECTIEKVR